jgi:beta-galactosidase
MTIARREVEGYMLYGASYYYEYQPYERLDEDVRMMHEAGISFVRMGDSIWSRCEPAEGRFDFDWLRRVLDAFQDADIKVVLCTPTYAIPPWLHRKHPEVMALYGDDRHADYGGRQNMDITNSTYLHYAERITRKLLELYARHPAIVGFQVDNETGSGMLHNPNVFQAFIDHLKSKYGSVERLNEIWGLNYWSHRLGEWEDLWTPAPRFRVGAGMSGNTNPSYDLEWRRFQSSLTTDFLAWQARLVREYARADQFITQDVVGGHGRGDSDRYEIAQVVDILSENTYHPTQDGLALPADDGTDPPVPEWMLETGAWSLYFKGDMGRSGRQPNFLVTEINALSIGHSANNFPAYDGQWRLAAYTYISRGANAIAYWHWHTLHYGNETYWGGILNHDLQPNRCYREISNIADELQRHGDFLTDLQADADVAFLYSQDSKYALEFQPCLRAAGSREPDENSYQRIFNSFYRAFFDARAQSAVVHPQQEFERFPVVVVPALYIADDALLDRLVRFAENGGHLLLSFRSGYADEYARARWQRAPGPLRSAVGASYNEFSNLISPVGLKPGTDGLSLPAEARAEAWADGLELEEATPLAYYDHAHFGRFPAIVSQPFEEGRVTYVGTLPNASLGQALATWVLTQANVQPVVAELPESVRASTARSNTGERLLFLSNWSSFPQTVGSLPVKGTELFSGDRFGPNDELSLGPWDVKIIVEA